jgi:hypothetical protein
MNIDVPAKILICRVTETRVVIYEDNDICSSNLTEEMYMQTVYLELLL